MSENPVTQTDAVLEDGKAKAALPVGEIKLDLFAKTDVGQVREHNEDNFLVADLATRDRGIDEPRVAPLGKTGALFAVCDGMGGAAAGEVASQLAVDIIFERMVDGLGESIARDDIARRLVRAVEAAGLRIYHEARADRSRRGMGTTVTAASLLDDHLFLAQVGDSRGYILRGETLVQVTRDQSLVNQLIEAGQLTEEEAENFEHNNIILQALGTADTVQVDLTFVQLRRGDTLMLCSDGLSGMVRNEEIRQILLAGPTPADACKTLIDRANQAGGHDNITVIVVRFDGPGLGDGAGDDPLKYRKYTLLEDPSEVTRPHKRPDGTPAPSAAAASIAPPASTNPAAAALGQVWQETGPHIAASLDEPVDIPGTHVPGWVVALLVLGVVALLFGTALLLLR